MDPNTACVHDGTGAPSEQPPCSLQENGPGNLSILGEDKKSTGAPKKLESGSTTAAQEGIELQGTKDKLNKALRTCGKSDTEAKEHEPCNEGDVKGQAARESNDSTDAAISESPATMSKHQIHTAAVQSKVLPDAEGDFSSDALHHRKIKGNLQSLEKESVEEALQTTKSNAEENEDERCNKGEGKRHAPLDARRKSKNGAPDSVSNEVKVETKEIKDFPHVGLKHRKTEKSMEKRASIHREDRDAATLGNEPQNYAAKPAFTLTIFISGLVFIIGILLCLSHWMQQDPEPKYLSSVDIFHKEFDKVKSMYPGQRTELWKRSRIHLTRHLNITHPTEPVSMILTAGRGAQQTLACLANHVASALASALNTSVTHVDGAGQASPDSDQVKLQLDQQLSSAFGEGRGVAVIHRFEELPPGSTLIFYRYCDHENSAFKRAALIFTILLDTEELETGLSLNDVEEIVHEYIEDKFRSYDQPAAFDKMDIDKLGGLWSRISHLILPVVSDTYIEQHGCKSGY